MKDGEVINDSNPVKNKEDDLNNYKIKKTTMNYLTALNLSFNNIKTKSTLKRYEDGKSRIDMDVLPIICKLYAKH